MICSKCDTELIGITRQLDKGKLKRLPICNKCFLRAKGLPLMPLRDAVVKIRGVKPIIKGKLYVE